MKHLHRVLLLSLLLYSSLFALTPTLQNSYSFQELQKLQSNDIAASDRFGYSVSLSGKYAVIGAKLADVSGVADAGAAYIYKKDINGSYTFLQKLTATNTAANNNFGSSVAIDGDYIVVAVPYDDAGGIDAGSIYIYKNDGNDNFTLLQYLQASDRQGSDYFGISVDISGEYIVVGAYLEDQKGSNAGAAYIFQNSSGTFTQVQKLTASNGLANDYFGGSVAIDGAYLIVGASGQDTTSSNSGAAYIFKNDGSGTFSELSMIKASDAGASDEFGFSVAISGNYFVVGADLEDPSGLTNAGSAYIFKNDGSDNFTQLQKIEANDKESSDYFGQYVAIDGDYVAVSKVLDDGVGSNSGAVYIYKNNGSDVFTQTAKLQAQDAQANDQLGYGLDIIDGTVATGAMYESTTASSAGSAYVFEAYLQADDFVENSSGVVMQINATNTTGYLLSGDDAALFDINSSGAITFKASPDYENPLDADANNEYVFTLTLQGDVDVAKEIKVKVINKVTEIQNSYSYQELQKLQASTPATSAYFGTSVAMDGNYAVVGARGESSNAGAAYIYKRGVDGNFTLLQKIVASDNAASTNFGSRVAIEGEYVVVGKYGDDAGGTDTGSIYIFKNDGSDNFTQTQKIQAADHQASDYFGISLDISGGYIVVGAHAEDQKGTDAGAAYIFKNSNGTFVQTQKLTASNAGASDNFGGTVAIDGNYVIVAAQGEDTGVTDAGMVYVFKNEGGSFVEKTQLQASNRSGGDYFGNSIAIDGDYVVIGASGDDATTFNAGSVYIFKNDGSDNFTQIQKLEVRNGQTNAYFGNTLTISGKDLVIGGYRSDSNGYGSGAVYLFENNGSDVFVQTGKMRASDAQADDYFGQAIALYDGTLLVGADYEDSGATSAGALYVFDAYVQADDFVENSSGVVIDINTTEPTETTGYVLAGADSALFDINSSGAVTFKASPDYENPLDADANNEYVFDVIATGDNNTTKEIRVKVVNQLAEVQNSYRLQELQKMQADTPAVGDYYGWSVDIDGEYAVVGAFGYTSAQGAAYIYKKGVDGNFTLLQKIEASDSQTNTKFGQTVAIHGEYVVVGRPLDNTGGDDLGAIYIFKNDGSDNFVQTQKIQAGDRQSSDNYGNSLAFNGEYIVVGALYEDTKGSNAGAVYILKNFNGTFKQVQKLMASNGGADDQFGGSVALDGDYVAVGAMYEDTGGTNAGMVYLFKNEGGSFIEVDTLLASDRQASDYFGRSVALKGEYIAVGAQSEDSGASDAGAVYIFKNNGDDSFSQVQKIQAADRQQSAYFGVSVLLDDRYLVVSAYRRSYGNGDAAGAVYLFENDGSDTFTQVEKIQSSDIQQDDYFANSLALSDGNLLVGVPYEDTGGDRAGSVYYFTPFLKSVDFAENGTGSVIDINITNATGYTLSGEDAALFSVDSAGVVTFKSAPDYENPLDADANNEYVFDVRSTGEVTKRSVHVQVSDVTAELQNSYTLQELQKKMSDSPAATAYFGSAVVLHGEYALIAEVGASSGAGALYLYKRAADGSFTQVQKITASDAGAGDHFGRSPVMDGEYLVVGADNEDAKGTNAGAAYVFKRGANGIYTQTQKLLASDGSNYDYFGTAVAMQGEYLVVSATGDDDVVNSSGSLYIFKNIDGTFVQVQKALAGSPRNASNFGGALAMDGEFLAVGAYNETLVNTNSGVVHIFKNIGGSFVETQEITADPRYAYTGFGFSVALQGDTLAVGAAYDDYGTPSNVTDAGSVYILKKDSNSDTFVQTQKLVADATHRETSSNFGSSVSLSGEYLAVGVSGVDAGLSDAGLAYIYKNDGSGTYLKTQILQSSDRAASDKFGACVAIDNGVVLVGAPYKAYNGNTIVGAAYFYTPVVSASSFQENGIGAVIEINATNTPAYTLTGADSAYFEVDSNGTLKFIGEPNYENPLDANGDNIYEVSVVANGESTIVQDFSIEVTNLINESKIALPSSRWTDILKGGQYDPTADLQAQSAIDLVGNADNTLLYLEYNDYVLSDPTDDRMEMRVRVGKNTVDSRGNLSGYIWLGMDVDLDGDLDLFLVVEGSYGTNKLYVYGAGAGANNSPNTTSLGTGVLLGVLQSNNLNFDTVKNLDGSSYVNLGNDGTNDDRYISFTFNFNDFKTVANALPLTNEGANISSLNGGVGLTKDTLMKFLVASAPSIFTLNGDIGGYGATDNYDTIYPIQGVYSDAMSIAALRDADIPDTTPPTLDHATPQDNAIEVAKDTNITLLFSELIHKGSGNILIKDASNSVVETVDVTSNAVSVFGGSATINPSASLALGSAYHVEIDAGAFKDDANNSYAGISDATTLNFTVVTNKAPILASSSFALSENNAIGTQVGVVTASDPENDAITYSITAGNTNGDFEINATTGVITLAKELNAYLIENYSLTVQAADSSALATQATISINVTDKIDAPVATADAATINEDNVATINLVANDTDKDFNLNPASVSISKKPDHGRLTLDSNGFAYYTPDANYYGSDYFTYSVADATGLRSNDVNVTITINSVNDIPVTINAVINTEEDTAATKILTAYTTDVDGDADISSYTIVSTPTYGSVSLVGDEITYTPGLNYYGTDSFTFSATDASGAVSNTSSVTINVAAVNDIPLARGEYTDLDEDTFINIDVLANDSDDGSLDPATVTVLNQPAHGTAVVETNGTITYTPDANFSGFDNFEYTVKDDGLITAGLGQTGVLVSNAATVSLRVNPINDAPIAVDDNLTLKEDTPFFMKVYTNDIDIDSQLEGNKISFVSQTTHGTLELLYGGEILYIPSKDYAGSDSFTYKISDGEYNSSVATVNLTVENVNDAPTITTAKNIDVVENTLNDYILTALDQENNTPFTYTIEGGADAALFSVYDGNKLTFLSAPNYEAPQDANSDNIYEVTIAARDNLGATGRKTLYFSVLNAPLSLFNDGGATTATVTANENNTSVTTIIASSGDDDNVTYAISGGADSAEFSIDATTGELTFTNPKDYESNGATTYVVEVNATNGSSTVTQTITVSIADVNEAPTFTSTPATTVVENSTYTYTPTFNDVDGDEVIWSASSIPSFLSVTSASNEVVIAGTGVAPVTDGSYDDADGQAADSVKINSGRLYIDTASSQVFYADAEEFGVRYVDASGDIQTFLAGDGSYYTLNPTAVAYNANDDVVYVTDYGKQKIVKVARDGTKSDLATGIKYYAQSLLYDKVNNLLYVGTRSAIYKIDLTDPNTATNKTLIIGNEAFFGSYLDTGVPATSLVNTVTSMALDKNGRLLFADRFNRLIRRIDFINNTIETIAGKSLNNIYGGDDGLAIDATFNDPNSLAIDIDGNIYVSERLDRSIRKITTDGKISLDRRISANGFIDSLAINNVTGDLYVQLSYQILKFSNAASLVGTPTVSGVYDVNLTVSDGNLTTTQNYKLTVTDVNDAPVIGSNTFVVKENSAVGTSLGVIGAIDEDGVSPSVDLIGSPETITYSLVAGNTNNDFTINTTTGEITVAKELNAYTTSRYYLTVAAQDDGGATGTAVVMVTVSNYNDTPVAVDDSATIDEDTNATIDLVANDTDRDFNINAASLLITQAPQHGSVELNTSGVATYIPEANYYGEDSFSYKVYDDTSLVSNEANVTLTINAVNDTPVTTSGVLQTDEDTNLNARLNDFASDVDGSDDISSYEIVTSPSNGVATISANVLQYVPNTNFYGYDTLTFRVVDGNGSISNVSTLHINVAAVNDIPIANEDATSTNEDTAVNIAILANDTDDGALDTGSVAILNQPAHGSVVVEGDGTVTYTPDANWSGNDNFTYTVEDDGLITNGVGNTGILISNAATVSVVVKAVNDAPVALDDSFTLDEDSSYLMNLIANDIDIDNTLDANATTFVTQPSNGSITLLDNGLVRYTPSKDYAGSDSFTYKISDGEHNSSVATVNLTINNVNDAPHFVTIKDQNVSENTSTIVTLDATDVENNTPFTYTVLNTKDGAYFTLNGANLAFKTAKDYESPEDANGDNIYSVDVNISDSLGATTTKTFDVEVLNVDDAPTLGVITNQIQSEDFSDFNISLVANDEDSDTIVLTATSNNESIAIANIVDGKLVVVSSTNANGIVSIEVNATANGKTATQTFDLDVIAVDDAPTLDAIANPVNQLEDFNDFNITLSATDIEGDPYSFSASSNDESRARVRVVGNQLIVSSVANAFGTVSINVTVTQDNNASLSDGKTVSLTIDPVNDRPAITTPLDDVVLQEDNGTTSYDINITDIDGDDLQVVVESNNTDILRVTPSWSGFINQATYLDSLEFNLTTQSNANGIVQITVTVDDNELNTTQTFDVNVTAVNDIPSFTTSSTLSIFENNTSTIVTLDATDVENNTPFTYTVLNTKDGAYFTLNGANLAFKTAKDYESPEDANGDNIYSVDVNISDSLGATTTKTFDVEVLNVDETPVVVKDQDTNTSKTETTTASGNSVSIEFPAGGSGTIETNTTSVGEARQVHGATQDANITIASNAKGETNSTIATESSSTVSSGDINKTIAMNENGDVTTRLSDSNTTIRQDAQSGSVTVATGAQESTSTEVSSSLPVTDVTVSDNGVVTISGNTSANSIDTNVTVTQTPTGELNSTVSSAQGSTSLSISSDLNVTATIDANGSVTTAFSNDTKESSITQTNAPSVAIETKVNGAGTTQIDVDGNATVNVTSSGEITVEQNATTVDGTSFIKKIVSSENGDTNSSVTVDGKTTTISTPANENNITVSSSSDGTYEVNVTKADGTQTQVQTDKDGALSVATASADGETTSSSSYPAGSSVTTNENNTTVVTQGLTNKIVTTIDNDGNIVVTSTTPPSATTQATFPQGSSVSVDENGVITVHDASGKTVVISEDGEVAITDNGVTTRYDNYPTIEASSDGEILVDGAIAIEGSTATKYTDFDGDGIYDFYDLDDDNDNISDIDEGSGAVDTDGDGAPDSKDLDSDNDTILDIIETAIDTDGDGVANFRDLDSDGDSKLDSAEGTGDDDLDGKANYIDANDNGSDEPIDNGDGTETITIKKAEGTGDDKVTSITTPNGLPYVRSELNDNSTLFRLDTPKVDTIVKADGGLDITMDESKGKHNISVANPGSDVKIEDNGDMSITTPLYTNSDLSTCQHDLRISYDGTDMITKHILGQSSGEDIITTIVMKIPDANISITSENKVINTGRFVNINDKAVEVIASVGCDGSVSTATTIEDLNTTFVAVNKAGSTIIVDVDGNVDTTTRLEVSDIDANLLEGLNFKIDSLSGDVNASKITKNGTTSEVTYTEAQIYLAGAKIALNGNKISDISVDLSQTRYVSVDVTDENNQTVSSTMSIDNTIADANISRVSNGETSAVTTKVITEDGFILLDNFLDGKTKHSVSVGGVTTQASSNLLGTDINVSKEGVTTSYADSFIALSVTALNDGVALHKVVLNGITTEARSEIIGASTLIDTDINGSIAMTTKVATTNANNQYVGIEVKALSNGNAQHKVDVNGVITQAISEIAGAKTVIQSNGDVNTTVAFPSSTALPSAVAFADGTALHKVKGNGFVSEADILLQGAKTVMQNEGIQTEVDTKKNECVVLGKLEYSKAKINTDTEGKTVTEFVHYLCRDNSESKVVTTSDASTPFSPNNKVTLKIQNAVMQLIIIAPVTDKIRF